VNHCLDVLLVLCLRVTEVDRMPLELTFMGPRRLLQGHLRHGHMDYSGMYS
jgi:hypothetical protein